MASAFDSAIAILDQVATTSIKINVHATGHFISTAQLKALREIHGANNTPAGSDTDDPTGEAASRLYKLEKQKTSLESKLRFETDPVQKTKLNHEIGKVSSSIAKLKRVLV